MSAPEEGAADRLESDSVPPVNVWLTFLLTLLWLVPLGLATLIILAQNLFVGASTPFRYVGF